MDDGLVVEGGPFVLAQADQHHLVQAALDLADEPGVRLDAPGDDDVVRLVRVLVEEDRHPVPGLADLHHLHRRPDRRPDVLLGDAVALDDFPLPLGPAAAVAAHRRDCERLGPEGLQLLDH